MKRVFEGVLFFTVITWSALMSCIIYEVYCDMYEISPYEITLVGIILIVGVCSIGILLGWAHCHD